MTDFFFYVIESSILLTILYLLYAVFLSRETFFQLNRFLLLAIPLLALTLPLLRIESNPGNATIVNQPMAEISSLTKSYYDAMTWELEAGRNDGSSSPVDQHHSSGWIRQLAAILVSIYLAGVVFCLSRTAWTIRWIVKAIAQNPSVEMEGIKIVKLLHPTAPFSFLKYVFVHEPATERDDFTHILTHERIHIQEKHTIDLLYVQLAAALFWFNPVIWRLLKSIKAIHEYIADKKVIQSGYSVSAYQAMLLRQLISNNSIGLVHNFNLSFIKKRITMMTNKKSGWAGRTKVVIALTAMIVCSTLIMQCNSRIDDQVSQDGYSKAAQDAIELPVLQKSDYKFNGDLSKAITLTLTHNTLHVNGKEVALKEIANLLNDTGDKNTPIIMEIDKNQQMGFVRKVEMALREADHRKLLYIGQTSDGERVQVSLMLPPDPKKQRVPDTSGIPDEHLLKINLDNNEGALNQQKVYDFVVSHLTNGEAELGVVSAKVNDNTDYGHYLTNYQYIREGYVKLYHERAAKMFGKNFYDTTAEEYEAVRKSIPMNIAVEEI